MGRKNHAHLGRGQFAEENSAGQPQGNTHGQRPERHPERSHDHGEDPERTLAREPAVPQEEGFQTHLPHEGYALLEDEKGDQSQDRNGRESDQKEPSFQNFSLFMPLFPCLCLSILPQTYQAFLHEDFLPLRAQHIIQELFCRSLRGGFKDKEKRDEGSRTDGSGYSPWKAQFRQSSRLSPDRLPVPGR